jgi:hypothetical protein
LKQLEKPSGEHVKVANQVMNYVRNTGHLSYLVEPEAGDECVLGAMGDSDSRGDKDSRLHRVPAESRSGTLSPSEAEYIEITECVQELMFVDTLGVSSLQEMQAPRDGRSTWIFGITSVGCL